MFKMTDVDFSLVINIETRSTLPHVRRNPVVWLEKNGSIKTNLCSTKKGRLECLIHSMGRVWIGVLLSELT